MERLELSQRIDRSPAEVFRFIATDHVRNHPRWDPNMHLEQITPGPIGVGTRIRRRYRRGETSVEGEMEIVEYEPDRAFAAVVRDGPNELRGRYTFEPEGEGSTRLTLTLESDVPAERMDPEPIQHAQRTMKALIELGE
jgi:uncharacterized protein YndB with AHSA1/START domain